MSTKMREIEVYRCWDDGSWDTDLVEIPAETPEEKIEEAAKQATLIALRHSADLPGMVGVYHIPEVVDLRTAKARPGERASRGSPGTTGPRRCPLVGKGMPPEVSTQGVLNMQFVQITMEGGVVQDMEVPCGIQVIVHDYDVEGVEEAELQTDENGDRYIEGIWGSPRPA